MVGDGLDTKQPQHCRRNCGDREHQRQHDRTPALFLAPGAHALRVFSFLWREHQPRRKESECGDQGDDTCDPAGCQQEQSAGREHHAGDWCRRSIEQFADMRICPRPGELVETAIGRGNRRHPGRADRHGAGYQGYAIEERWKALEHDSSYGRIRFGSMYVFDKSLEPEFTLHAIRLAEPGGMWDFPVKRTN